MFTAISQSVPRCRRRGTLVAIVTMLVISSSLLAQTSHTNADARLIASVKQVSVSSLDAVLPSIPFVRWLQIEAGTEARISFAVRSAADDSDHADFPTCVEADAQLNDGRHIWIFIAVRPSKQTAAAKFSLRSATILTQHETIDVPRLSDISAILIRTHEIVAHPEIAQ